MAERRCPNERLRALLREAGWTHEAFARAVNSVGSEIGLSLAYDRSSVSHWLAGTRPNAPVPQLIVEALTRRTGRAMTAGAAGFEETSPQPPPSPQDPLNPQEPPAVRRAGAAETVNALAVLSRQDTDPVTRAPLLLRPFRAAVSHVPVWAEPQEAPAEPLSAERMRVGSSEVAVLRGAVRFFASSMDAHGGAHARVALAACIADTAVPWLRAPGPQDVRDTLRTETARLAFVLARMHADMSGHGLAQRYLRLSMELANQTRDRVTWAVALRAIGAQSLALGHRRTALHCVEAAVDALPAHASHAVRAFALAQLALTRAAVGERHAALTALAAAERSGERSWDHSGDRPPEDGGPFAHYPPAALAFQTAETLHRLGQFAAASRALEQSLRHRAAADRRGRALTLARQAEILLEMGQLEEACATWREFLRAGDGLRSHTVGSAVQSMRAGLTPYRGHPALHGLHPGAPHAAAR
ncbi:helix-turn-helix transcriptional regulator [Streptomyces sp. NPDC050610]|uniref:helix-turn-helix transcriptional regulator n=1 Tax=Streptomyces sp. NPDC050610 TaxID=3157097 RepID=UPI0034499653